MKARARKAKSSACCFRSTNVRMTAAAGTIVRSWEGVAYNGGTMRPDLYVGGKRVDGDVIVDLDSARMHDADLPIFDEHDESNDGLIGRTTSFKIDKSSYTVPVSGVLYLEKKRTKDLMAASRGGHEWQLSIGMDSFQVDRVPQGRSVFVNGRTFSGPVNVLRNGLITDVSFTALGGDNTTWAKIAARRARLARLHAGAAKGIAMNFEAWMKSTYPDVDVATLSDVDLQKYKDEYAGSDENGDSRAEANRNRGDEEGTLELTDEEVEMIQAHRSGGTRRTTPARRVNANRAVGGDGASVDSIIERATAAALRASRAEDARRAHIRAMAGDQTELAQKAIDEDWTTKDFELAVLRAGRSTHSGANTQGNEDETAQIMEAALLMHCRMEANRVAKFFSEKIMNEALSKDYRGFSLVECADRLVRRAGVAYRGSRNQEAHMKASRSASERLQASGFTSLTLSSILENVGGKVLLDAYAAVQTVWQTIAAVRSLNDFKPSATYALDPTSVFKRVGAQGDFEQVKFSDRKYVLQCDSWGLRFKLDYQTWRNDDLGAISDRLTGVGNLAASTIEQVIFLLIMNGINNASLFHTNNRNYLANSANYVLGLTGMTNAETAIMNQIRANGTPLGVELNQLVVGTALKSVAGTLYTSSKLNETTTTDKGKGSDNPFVNKYLPTVAPYLNNALLKDNDGATIPHQDAGLWMLFGRSGNSAPIHVGFLDGQQAPTISSLSNPVEMVGFELVASMHFGCGYGDPMLALCCNPNNA